MIGKKAGIAFAIIFLLGLFPVYQLLTPSSPVSDMLETVEAEPEAAAPPPMKSIASQIETGETLFSIFRKHDLSLDDLYAIKQASAAVHRLRNIHPGQPYSITIDEQNAVNCFTYSINENTTLRIERQEDGFIAHKDEIPYESRVLTIGGRIEDSLIAAIGGGREETTLAVSVSDILAWDIDFNTDLRKGDSFRIIVEGLYLQDDFKRYGSILAIEFINDNRTVSAYRFEHDGRIDYYDTYGKSLRKAFLKAPLSFRRISSGFSLSRRHPILKINRPHHGIDYAAPAGTPVSTTADGRVTFAGRKGDYGNLVIVSHRNGLSTYYGHLSKFARGIRTGSQVRQGDLVGYVGMTGLASGPHLHYELRQHGRHINPSRFKMAAGDPVPAKRMDDFLHMTAAFNKTFAQSVFHEVRDTESRENARRLAFRMTDEAAPALN